MKKIRRLNLAVTSACNCRCEMCSIWEQNDRSSLKLGQYCSLFQSKMLSNVSHVSLTGGEPTLRKDLSELAKLVSNAFPHLIQLSLNSNGLAPSLIERQVKDILLIINEKCQLNIGLSFDGVGDVHDKIRGVTGAFLRVNESIARMQNLLRAGASFGLSLRCTITRHNVRQLNVIEKYCEETGLPIQFAIASDPDAFINAKRKRNHFLMNSEELELCREFFQKKAFHYPYYNRSLDFLIQNRRNFGCIGAERMTVLVLPNGDVLPCGESKKLLLGNINNNSFDEIWTSEQAKNVFLTISNVCAVCPSQCYPIEYGKFDEINIIAKSLLPMSFIKLVRHIKRAIQVDNN